MTKILWKQGAEGRIFESQYNGIKCLIKERFVKKYRHPDLDTAITKERMRAEVKAIKRCSAAGILTPKIVHINENEREIYIEFFENSQTAKDYIGCGGGSSKSRTNEELRWLCNEIGIIVAKLHSNHIIHGDLTTSNLLLNPHNNSNSSFDVILIDFGLSHHSLSLEDKGVDLYVLERSLLSTHSDIPFLFEWILEKYKLNITNQCQEILTKFEEVRARGRKRTMIG